MSDRSVRNESHPVDVALFRHARRKDWGVAALLWEHDGKRGYQFADGKLRVFKQGFYHLFESAKAPEDGSAKAVRRLARLARAEERTEAARLPTLRDQILLFRRSYPGGFVSEAWQRKHRGRGRRLKRHREPAIREAATKLGGESLDALIERFAWSEIHARLTSVLAETNLVPTAQQRKLERVPASRELSVALRDWIVGHDDEAELERRFNLLARLLGPAGTWSIVTAIAGLVDPERHVCVRPSVFETQAMMLLSEFEAGKRPRFVDYQRYVQVAQTVREELERAGLPPTDLLDVHDFIWETLRPAARAELTRERELPVEEADEVEGEREAA